GIRPVVINLRQVVDDELGLETPLLALHSFSVVCAGSDELGGSLRVAVGVPWRWRRVASGGRLLTLLTSAEDPAPRRPTGETCITRPRAGRAFGKNRLKCPALVLIRVPVLQF